MADPEHSSVPWTLDALRKKANEVKDEVAPWWAENSQGCYLAVIADVVMGQELKKTGAGNLFTVFGEADVVIKDEDDQLTVILNGVDVYDPDTGDIRSNHASQIALWMIDTAYNGESHFVRHCYVTGGQDLYARLKKALKAGIDEDVWPSLNRTESRPFPKPDTGKIAVKVINDYGHEVVKVFPV